VVRGALVGEGGTWRGLDLTESSPDTVKRDIKGPELIEQKTAAGRRSGRGALSVCGAGR